MVPNLEQVNLTYSLKPSFVQDQNKWTKVRVQTKLEQVDHVSNQNDTKSRPEPSLEVEPIWDKKVSPSSV